MNNRSEEYQYIGKAFALLKLFQVLEDKNKSGHLFTYADFYKGTIAVNLDDHILSSSYQFFNLVLGEWYKLFDLKLEVVTKLDINYNENTLTNESEVETQELKRYLRAKIATKSDKFISNIVGQYEKLYRNTKYEKLHQLRFYLKPSNRTNELLKAYIAKYISLVANDLLKQHSKCSILSFEKQLLSFRSLVKHKIDQGYSGASITINEMELIKHSISIGILSPEMYRTEVRLMHDDVPIKMIEILLYLTQFHAVMVDDLSHKLHSTIPEWDWEIEANIRILDDLPLGRHHLLEWRKETHATEGISLIENTESNKIWIEYKGDKSKAFKRSSRQDITPYAILKALKENHPNKVNATKLFQLLYSYPKATELKERIELIDKSLKKINRKSSLLGLFERRVRVTKSRPNKLENMCFYQLSTQ